MAEEGFIVDIRGEESEASEKDSRLNHAMRREREGGSARGGEERGGQAEKERSCGQRRQEPAKPGPKSRGPRERVPEMAGLCRSHREEKGLETSPASGLERFRVEGRSEKRWEELRVSREHCPGFLWDQTVSGVRLPSNISHV